MSKPEYKIFLKYLYSNSAHFENNQTTFNALIWKKKLELFVFWTLFFNINSKIFPSMTVNDYRYREQLLPIQILTILKLNYTNI